MSFMDEHVGTLPKVSPRAAVGEAIQCINEGGVHTWQMLGFCGAVFTLFYWAEVWFGFEGAGATIPQTIIESYFIYNWHRYVLVGDKSFGSKHWGAFVRRSLLYYVVGGVVVVLLVLPVGVGASGLGPTELVMLTVAAIVLIYVVVPRIALVFPALALDSETRKLKDALALSSGNTARLSLAYLLMTFLILAVFIFLGVVVFVGEAVFSSLISEDIYTAISGLLFGLGVALTVLLWAGLNSSLYRQLGGDIPASVEE